MKTMNDTNLSAYNDIAQANRHAHAALVAKYHGPTNTKGARISVFSQHTIGRKFYAWEHELDTNENYRAAFGRYLSAIYVDSVNRYGGNGWGSLSDGVHGVLADGSHVWTPCFHKAK